MNRRGTATLRWVTAFVLLALAALASLGWTLLERPVTPAALLESLREALDTRSAGAGAQEDAQEGAQEGAQEAAAPASALPSEASQKLQLSSGGAPLTLAGSLRQDLRLDIVEGGAELLWRGAGEADAHVVPTGEPGPWVIRFGGAEPWAVYIDEGAERLTLDLADAWLEELLVRPPLQSSEGTLPRSGRTVIELGDGRSSLLWPRDSRVDARLTLGDGPLVLRFDPGARGRLEMMPGSGPSTLIVDATVTVALELPADPPPLALEGTWWLHENDRGAAWVRSPRPATPLDAELTLTLVEAGGAPLAITYR